MRLLRAFALLPAVGLTACHSAFINATIQNRTAQPIELIEIDYPSASFGTQSLAPGADFHYRFKVLGEGKMKLTYTDSTHQEKNFEGPFLKENAEGTFTITILPNEVQWKDETHAR